MFFREAIMDKTGINEKNIKKEISEIPINEV